MIEANQSKAETVIALLQSLLACKVDIEKALEYANKSHSFDDIVDMVVTGAVHYYALENSFVIMEVHNFPNHSNYHTFLAGGDMTEILDVNDWMLDNARALGCKYVTVTGRKGWERQLKKYGWDYRYTVMAKAVTQ